MSGNTERRPADRDEPRLPARVAWALALWLPTSLGLMLGLVTAALGDLAVSLVSTAVGVLGFAALVLVWARWYR